MIPVLDLKAQYAAIGQEIESPIKKVLLSKEFILGPAVGRLGREVADYCSCSMASASHQGPTPSGSRFRRLTFVPATK